MIRQNFKHSFGVTGKATLVKKNGEKFTHKNTVTNIGLSEIVYSLLDKSMPQFYFAVGDDDSNILPDQVALQTALTSEKVRHAANTLDVQPDIDSNFVYTVESEFGASNDPELNTNPATTLRELGLFNRFAEGEMFARAQTSAPFTMDYQSIYSGIWSVKFNIQDFLTSGGIVYTGSKICCEALKKSDDLVDNSNNYYDAGKDPSNFFTPCPWGLNLVSLGDNDSSGNAEMLDLNSPKTLYDSLPTITRLDLTGEGSDVNYEAKIIIQKYIPINTIPFIIKEAGLFNQRTRRNLNDSSNIETVRTMFSRSVLNVPIPANSEAVLTWVIGFKRGA